MPESDAEKQAAVQRIERLAASHDLPGVKWATHYGNPCLKVAGKPMATVKEARLLVLHCPLEAKDMLMEMAPDIYFQTDHFKGWPAVLVHLDAIGDEELALRIENAWRFRAPSKLLAQRPTEGT